MGAAQSGGIEIGGSSMGYQVLRVYPNSPGIRAGFKAYFDFIIAIGNARFNVDNASFREILKASLNQKLKVIVYNTRTKKTREVEVVPSNTWGGNGLLGVSIKHSSFDKADERVWHVVDVESGSPAYQAGLKPGEDYVIGSDSILQENDDLYNLIEKHEGKALRLFVYNVNTDNCREVVCHPNSKWGGKGYLGCEFGHGLLHRIPSGETDQGDDNPKASLIKNQQASPVEESKPTSGQYSFQSKIMQHQMNQLQKPTQPGHQLLHQTLFENRAPHQPPHSQSSSSQQMTSQLTQQQQHQMSNYPNPEQEKHQQGQQQQLQQQQQQQQQLQQQQQHQQQQQLQQQQQQQQQLQQQQQQQQQQQHQHQPQQQQHQPLHQLPPQQQTQSSLSPHQHLPLGQQPVQSQFPVMQHEPEHQLHLAPLPPIQQAQQYQAHQNQLSPPLPPPPPPPSQQQGQFQEQNIQQTQPQDHYQQSSQSQNQIQFSASQSHFELPPPQPQLPQQIPLQFQQLQHLHQYPVQQEQQHPLPPFPQQQFQLPPQP